MLRNKTPWQGTVHGILDELVASGNLIAKFHQAELRSLDEHLMRLATTTGTTVFGNQSEPARDEDITAVGAAYVLTNTSMASDTGTMTSQQFEDWNSDISLNGDQLLALADSLDIDQLDWLDTDMLNF